jgi:hypothetical protein
MGLQELITSFQTLWKQNENNEERWHNFPVESLHSPHLDRQERRMASTIHDSEG